MPNEDLWNTDADSDEQGPKALREHLKQVEKQRKDLEKALEDMRAENAKLLKDTRESKLGNLLRDKQVSPRIAKWIARDEVEATEEAVTKWLEENGEDFGYKPGQAEKPADQQQQAQQAVVSQNEQDAYTAVLGLREGQADIPSPIDQRLTELGSKATSFDEVVAALREMQAPLVGSYGT